jgi:hypothetical protein
MLASRGPPTTRRRTKGNCSGKVTDIRSLATFTITSAALSGDNRRSADPRLLLHDWVQPCIHAPVFLSPTSAWTGRRAGAGVKGMRMTVACTPSPLNYFLPPPSSWPATGPCHATRTADREGITFRRRAAARFSPATEGLAGHLAEAGCAMSPSPTTHPSPAAGATHKTHPEVGNPGGLGLDRADQCVDGTEDNWDAQLLAPDGHMTGHRVGPRREAEGTPRISRVRGLLRHTRTSRHSAPRVRHDPPQRRLQRENPPYPATHGRGDPASSHCRTSLSGITHTPPAPTPSKRSGISRLKAERCAHLRSHGPFSQHIRTTRKSAAHSERYRLVISARSFRYDRDLRVAIAFATVTGQLLVQ